MVLVCTRVSAKRLQQNVCAVHEAREQQRQVIDYPSLLHWQHVGISARLAHLLHRAHVPHQCAGPRGQMESQRWEEE